MSCSFMETLNLTSSALAEGYLTRLSKAGVNLIFKDSAAGVEEAIEAFGSVPWDDKLEPYFIATRSEKDATVLRIKSLPEYKQLENSGLEEETTPIIKRRFIEVDSVYRHLRNALAHGCFRCTSKKNADCKRLFFYDLDRNSSVSSCALIPISTLNDWYKISCSVAKKKL